MHGKRRRRSWQPLRRTDGVAYVRIVNAFRPYRKPPSAPDALNALQGLLITWSWESRTGHHSVLSMNGLIGLCTPKSRVESSWYMSDKDRLDLMLSSWLMVFGENRAACVKGFVPAGFFRRVLFRGYDDADKAGFFLSASRSMEYPIFSCSSRMCSPRLFCRRSLKRDCSGSVSRWRAVVSGQGSLCQYWRWARRVSLSMRNDVAVGKYWRNWFRMAKPWVSMSPQ